MALIDSDALIKEFERNPTDGLYTNEIVAVVREAPEVDPVHAAGGAYCHECIYRNAGFCVRLIGAYDANGFCSRGRRREGAE